MRALIIEDDDSQAGVVRGALTGMGYTYDDGKSESFHWDGLALIQRGDEQFINEPHVGNAPKKLRFEGKPRAQRSARRARKGPRDNPVVSSKGTSYFNDMLGTTLGAKGKYRKYSAATLTAFGERLDNADDSSSAIRSLGEGWFTGKPHVEGLGHAFLFRNYRAGLAKWQTADPIGYPDGWNALAYCGNAATGAVDLLGSRKEKIVSFDTDQSFSYNFVVIPFYNGEWDAFGLARQEALKAGKSIEDWVKGKLTEYKKSKLDDFDSNSLMVAFLQYFSNQQGGGYNEIPPSDDIDPWRSILEENESAGWELEWGPVHTGVTLMQDEDIVNAGIGALIITGCMHHWQAKFVKE